MQVRDQKIQQVSFLGAEKLHKIEGVMAKSKPRMKPSSTEKGTDSVFLRCVIQVVNFLHQAFDSFVEIIFGWWYCESKRKTIPPLKNSLLLESAVSLAEKIRKKEVRSEDVVKSCIARIREVNPVLNAVVDERFEEAIKEAQAIDAIVASSSEDELKRNKPFLGVPFTTKDSAACKGLRYTLGIWARRDVRADEDSDAIAHMKAAGGILLGVTNVPESVWCEARNMIYGQTNNPYDTRRTSGGSSGGEGTIIAACGSPLGIGTDTGGSIRIPALFCGIFGHKPTTGLISTKGLSLQTGEEGFSMLSAGPMSRYAEDLSPVLRVLVGNEKAAKELKLDDEISLADLKFIYSDSIGDIHTSPVRADMMEPLIKAVNHFKEISKQPVCKVQIRDMKYSFKLWRYWMLREPENELTDKEGHVVLWKEVPLKLLGLSKFSLGALSHRVMADFLPNEDQVWAEEKTKSIVKELVELLGENGVLLFPSSAVPAMHHYASFLMPFNFIYFGIFNALNLPVTQVPMGLNKQGLPVGIQVVAAPNNDHLCFAVAKELQKVFGGFTPPFCV